MRLVAAGIIAALGLAIITQSENQAGEKAKHTIAEVMKTAMKGGLCGKVAGGKASDDEKKQLIELFTSLSQNKPPKGDEAAWKERTSALLKAAKEGDAAGLKKNANCGTCHKAFKG